MIVLFVLLLINVAIFNMWLNEYSGKIL